MRERNETTNNKTACTGRKATHALLLCSLLLCGLLIAGCGSKSTPDDSGSSKAPSVNTQAPTAPVSETAQTDNAASIEKSDENGDSDLVIRTDYGDLHYPGCWQEYADIQQKKVGESIAVTFKTEADGKMYELFKVVIGSDSGSAIGCLTDKKGIQHNVYLYVEEIAADKVTDKDELSRLYAMQEDLNYLIEHLN